MTAPIVTDYLLELSDALADVPRETRVAILAGVREELEGLDGDEASARIRELGDPEFIASGAREEAPVAPAESRWIAVVAALLVMIGGVVVPFVGWLGGIVLMWTSRTWSRRVKLLATFLPVLVVLQSQVINGLASLIATRETGLDGFRSPSLDEFESVNPLIPDTFHLMSISVILAIPVGVLVGVWLLVLALRPAPVIGGSRLWSVIPIIAGSLVLPPAGWVVGLVVLWTSTVPARTKAVLTTSGPVALILSLALASVFTRDPIPLIATAIAVPFVATLAAAVLLLRRPTRALNP